ncbi:hypothetical protein [Devosia marina]|uniref:Group 4 capsule polysaccharide lipoprotein gfcB, YjbF n=1 Tax=Devosia marina TaxID=2683198 RepID=A0A7X3FVB0_9HYPH|nr:hypothetical protein [Devosia marina]MVT00863.1 hypothetical protein [Devosia marina]
MPSSIKTAVLTAGLMMLAAPASAQSALPFTQDAGRLVLDALGQRLTMPLPDWVAADADLAAISERVSTRFLEDGGQAQLTIYKRGEGEAFWSTLYGARISTETNMDLAEFRSRVVNVYAQSCDPDAVALFQLEPDAEDALPPLGYVCGAYLDAFTDFAGQGEVMVMGFYKSEAGLGLVFQEWRGEAFDASAPASWPVPAETVEARMAQFTSEVSLTLLD